MMFAWREKQNSIFVLVGPLFDEKYARLQDSTTKFTTLLPLFLFASVCSSFCHPFVHLFLFVVLLVSLCVQWTCAVLVLASFCLCWWNRASLFWNRGNDGNRNPTTGFCDLGDLHHSSAVFHQDGVDLGSSNLLSLYLVAPYEQNEYGFSVVLRK